MNRQKPSLKPLLINTVQIFAGFAIYALLVTHLFVGATSWAIVYAVGGAFYVFVTSFLLAKQSVKRGIHAAFFVAVPSFLFAILAVMDLILYGKFIATLVWAGIGAMIVLIGYSGAVARKKCTAA
ncbi:hypothetical protein [Alteromonas sp. H39]|uniref:hypothetical protein n=1 Tax=Alteromonas sp. H39 TaxID=3389876 RepID=UPI0039E185FE